MDDEAERGPRDPPAGRPPDEASGASGEDDPSAGNGVVAPDGPSADTDVDGVPADTGTDGESSGGDDAFAAAERPPVEPESIDPEHAAFVALGVVLTVVVVVGGV